MCGIAGCVGHESAPEFTIEGLEHLEYRGYDSAGIAYQDQEGLSVVKTAGRIANLRSRLEDPLPKSALAIGHTRWATHGEPSLENAHPHTDNLGNIAVVHNGIIENSGALKEKLSAEGYKFLTETDTEVIPNLIDLYYGKTDDMAEALKLTTKDLIGTYAILACSKHTPDTLYAATLSSPLIIGNNDGRHLVASDARPLAHHANDAITMDDYEIAVITPQECIIQNAKNGNKTSRKPQSITDEFELAELGDYPHFMLKEIHEAPSTVLAAINGRVNASKNLVRLGGLESVRDKLDSVDRLAMVACGTSYYAGMVGKYLIEEISGMPVDLELASEFKDRSSPISPNTAMVAISQSGETADTIAALKKVDKLGVLKLGIVNAPGSQISRLTDAGVYCHAGPEVAVASTKAFISQVTVLSELALRLSKQAGPEQSQLMQELEDLPKKLESLLEKTDSIEALAKKYAHYSNFSFIGRGYNYPTAMEGALKLKEVSYIHAEGYSAGELKHGPIALIDEDHPTMAIATDDKNLSKTIANIQEIKARKGPVIAVTTEGNKELAELCDDIIEMPPACEQVQPILAGTALQLFAYFVAVEKGCDVDKPRNLAKSVTVQ